MGFDFFKEPIKYYDEGEYFLRKHIVPVKRDPISYYKEASKSIEAGKPVWAIRPAELLQKNRQIFDFYIDNLREMTFACPNDFLLLWSSDNEDLSPDVNDAVADAYHRQEGAYSNLSPAYRQRIAISHIGEVIGKHFSIGQAAEFRAPA